MLVTLTKRYIFLDDRSSKLFLLIFVISLKKYYDPAMQIYHWQLHEQDSVHTSIKIYAKFWKHIPLCLETEKNPYFFKKKNNPPRMYYTVPS